MANDKSFNMDALLDGTLDALKDMPEFKPFPKGAHRVVINIEQKKIDGWPTFEIKMKALETVELADATSDQPLEAGAEASVAYFMAHEKDIVAELGQGKFKLIMASAAEKFGAKSNRDLIADCQGAEVMVITGLRDNKDKTKQYTDIEAMTFA
jgi:hypothetical protein